MRRFSVRPSRLIDALQDPTRPLNVTITECVLDYSTLLSPSLEVRRSTPLVILHFPPKLLPGGRWIISGFRDIFTLSTRIFCWDSLHFRSGSSPPEPIASFGWQEQKPDDEGDWMQAQWDTPNSVVLACSLVGWPRANDNVSIDIMRLIWTDDPNIPVLERAAQLKPAQLPASAGSSHLWNCLLEGDYLVINGCSSIFVWNWKEDKMCEIIDEDRNWVRSLTLHFGSLYLHIDLTSRLVKFIVSPGRRNAPLYLYLPSRDGKSIHRGSPGTPAHG
ncbi:hypothetical protein DL93DRAFT_406154 [Clavulina sp. PMI_390]|nr:hypothetical protein DL93DRAFT_406154 [Clavulina sp. PMI_390]